MGKRNYKKMDGATIFKYKSLNAIQRRKKIAKYSYMGLVLVAILLFIAVVVVYTVN